MLAWAFLPVALLFGGGLGSFRMWLGLPLPLQRYLFSYLLEMKQYCMYLAHCSSFALTTAFSLGFQCLSGWGRSPKTLHEGCDSGEGREPRRSDPRGAIQG